ncbi:MAG: hypothetical protein U5L11_06405 [Arhodomonas sp.]|nr:hypothetical protein [Arhodomonas sp.]
MFWNDPDMSRYKGAYFETFPGVWAHGDYIELSPSSGGSIIHGRSDATLNPGGVRIGTAEIYRQVETPRRDRRQHRRRPARWTDDVRVVLLVVLNEGHALTERAQARDPAAHHAKGEPRGTSRRRSSRSTPGPLHPQRQEGGAGRGQDPAGRQGGKPRGPGQAL